MSFDFRLVILEHFQESIVALRTTSFREEVSWSISAFCFDFAAFNSQELLVAAFKRYFSNMLRGSLARVSSLQKQAAQRVHSQGGLIRNATTAPQRRPGGARHAASDMNRSTNWDVSATSPRMQGLKRVHGVELAQEVTGAAVATAARDAAETTDIQDAVRSLRACVSAALAGERQTPTWNISGPNASPECFELAPAATAVLDSLEQRVMHSEELLHPAIIAAALELIAMDPQAAAVLRTDTRAGIPFGHLARQLAGSAAPIPAGNLATTVRALTHLHHSLGEDRIALDVLYSSAAGVVHDTSVDVSFSFLLTRLAAQSALSVQTALTPPGPSAGRAGDVATDRRLSPLDVWTVVMNAVQYLPVTNLRALLYALRPTLGEVTHALRTVNSEVDNLLFADCNKWQLHGERGVLRAVRAADKGSGPSPVRRALQHQAVVQRWAVDILEVLALSKMGYRLSHVALPLMQTLHTSLHAAAPADVWWRCMVSFAHIPGESQASKLLGTLLDRAGALMPLPAMLPPTAASKGGVGSAVEGGPADDGTVQSNGRKPFLSTVTRLELPPASDFLVHGPGVRGAPKGAKAWKALQPLLPVAAKKPPPAHSLPLQHTLLTPEGAAQLMQAQAAHNGGSMRSRLGVVERLANHVWLNRSLASTDTLISSLCAVCKLNEGTLAHPTMVLALLEAVDERLRTTSVHDGSVTPLQVVKLLEAQADIHLVHPEVTQWCLQHLREHMSNYGILDLSHVVNSLVKQSYTVESDLEQSIMQAVQGQLLQLASNSSDGMPSSGYDGDLQPEDPSQGAPRRSRQGGKGSTLRQLHPQAGDAFTADATTHMFLAHAVVSYTTGALWSICERALQPGVSHSDPYVLEMLRFVPHALHAVEACIPNDITSAIKRRLPHLESDGWASGAVLPVSLPPGDSVYLGQPVPPASGSADSATEDLSPQAVVVRPSIPMRTVLRHLPLRQLVISPRAWLLLQALRTHCLRLADQAADPEIKQAAQAAVQALPPHLWHTAELVSAAWVASTTHNVPADMHEQLAAAYVAASASGAAPPIQGSRAGSSDSSKARGGSGVSIATAASDSESDGGEGGLGGVSEEELLAFMEGGRSSEKVRAALMQGAHDDSMDSSSESDDDAAFSGHSSDEEFASGSGSDSEEWEEGGDEWEEPLAQLLRNLPDELPLKAVAGGPMLGPHDGTPQHLTRIAEVLEQAPGMPPFAPHTLINGIRADFVFPTRRVVLEVQYPVTHSASVRWEELPQLPETLHALKHVQDWRPFNKFFVQLSRRLRAGHKRGGAAAGAAEGVPEVPGVSAEDAAALWHSAERLTDGKVWRSVQGAEEGTIAARRAAALRWMGWTVLTVPQHQLTNPTALPEELKQALFASKE